MLSHALGKNDCLEQTTMIERSAPRIASERNSGKDSLGGSRPEFRELRQAPIASGFLELIETVDPELLVYEVHFLHAESGYTRHLNETGGNVFAEAVEVAGFSCLDELLNDGYGGGSDVGSFLELTGFE
jgi:hypothetical protein